MSANRLLDTLDTLAAFTETPGNGVTRFSWSETDGKARQYLVRELEEIGLAPYEDGIGNLRAVMEGEKNLPRVVVGSHLDSVRNGGPLDGAYGVAAALEVLRRLRDRNEKPLRPIEFIAFAEEEGSNFGSTCLGSKAVAGQIDAEGLKALRGDSGKSAYETLRDFGLTPDALPEQQMEPSSVAVYFEAHIEQGDRLETAGKRLGVVEAITGMRLMAFTFSGRSNHAASPMRGRRDPMAAFAETAFRLEELWKNGAFPQNMSVTVGRIDCSPNVGIIVPEEVAFTVDLRHVDAPALEAARQTVEKLAADVASARGVGAEKRLLSASGGVRMHAAATGALIAAARSLGVEPERLVSGPAHDAAPMGRIVPAGLLFVPSIQGLSHCPREKTLPEDLLLGALVLEKAVCSAAFCENMEKRRLA